MNSRIPVSSTRKTQRKSRAMNAVDSLSAPIPYSNSTMEFSAHATRFKQNDPVRRSVYQPATLNLLQNVKSGLKKLAVLSYSGNAIVQGFYDIVPLGANLFKLTKQLDGGIVDVYMGPKCGGKLTKKEFSALVGLGADAKTKPFELKPSGNNLMIIPLKYSHSTYGLHVPKNEVTVKNSTEHQKIVLRAAVREIIDHLLNCLSDDESTNCAKWVFKAYIINSVADGAETTVVSDNRYAGGFVTFIKSEGPRVTFVTPPAYPASVSDTHFIDFTPKKEYVLHALQQAVALKCFTTSTSFEYRPDEKEWFYSSPLGEFVTNFGKKGTAPWVH